MTEQEQAIRKIEAFYLPEERIRNFGVSTVKVSNDDMLWAQRTFAAASPAISAVSEDGEPLPLAETAREPLLSGRAFALCEAALWPLFRSHDVRDALTDLFMRTMMTIGVFADVEKDDSFMPQCSELDAVLFANSAFVILPRQEIAKRAVRVYSPGFDRWEESDLRTLWLTAGFLAYEDLLKELHMENMPREIMNVIADRHEALRNAGFAAESDGRAFAFMTD